MTRSRTSLACSAGITFGLVSVVLLAGPLDPPAGPVASTHKTLSEVEPRIAINSSNTRGDANSVYRIAQPGSYYLTSDVAGAVGKHGIEIAASKVTIDLNGFSLTGVVLSADGITTDGVCDEITIRNGTIASWGGSGIDLTAGGAGTGARIENVTCSSNAGSGIHSASNVIIRGCTARDNGTVGIEGSTNATITDCVASGNGTYGIEGIRGTVINNCTAVGNTTSGIVCNYAGVISNCAASQNGGDGLVGFLGCSIVDCASYQNTGDGIRVTGDCIVRGNMCAGNGVGSVIAAGIHCVSGDNRIEGNNCIANDFGVDIDTGGNVIVRNTSSGNTQNWVIATNNIYGTIVDRTSPGSPAVAGNSGAGTMGSTDPNANFSY